ncbi:unnamed protein product [Boreogadus saida]
MGLAFPPRVFCCLRTEQLSVAPLTPAAGRQKGGRGCVKLGWGGEGGGAGPFSLRHQLVGCSRGGGDECMCLLDGFLFRLPGVLESVEAIVALLPRSRRRTSCRGAGLQIQEEEEEEEEKEVWG